MQRVGPYAGELDPSVDTPAARAALAAMAALVTRPESRVLTAGRNRNVRVVLEVGDDIRRAVVVKAFGRAGPLSDAIARFRGSKARRTWLAARFLERAGVGTPAPLAWFERWRGGCLVESYFVAAAIDDVSSFTQELKRLFEQESQGAKLMALMLCVARAIRAMHDAGFVHRDLGNQNILLRRTGPCEWGDVRFIDLNRSRRPPSVSLPQRARDLSRIALPSDLRRVFLAMYWGDAEPPPATLLRWERRYRRRFAVHTWTRAWRHPLRARRLRAAGDAGATYPHARDLWIWDDRAGQALTVLDARDRHRHYPLGRNLGAAWATALLLGPVWREYRRLLPEAFRRPVEMRGRIGVAVEPHPDTWEREAALLRKLGAGLPVLVRFCHHEPEARHAFLAGVVRGLAAEGRPVMLALVQDRQAVLAPAAWTRFVERVMDLTAGCVEAVEIGHAINRVKWGIWSIRDYRALLQPFAALVARYPKVEFLGPAAIDFEYTYVAQALRGLPSGFRFDALSHHLYVDRRGAPENRQGRFATLEKAALLRAIANVSRGCGSRVVVSEVNWPLLGTGIHSPVGAPHVYPGGRRNDPSVSEADYADYMIRYLLIALCSGFVSRVFWWRLAARGYGLVDDGDPSDWRERPAYAALRRFVAEAGDARFTGLEVWGGERRGMSGVDACYAYRFERPGRDPVRIAYTSAGMRPLPGTDVTLTGCPVYVPV